MFQNFQNVYAVLFSAISASSKPTAGLELV